MLVELRIRDYAVVEDLTLSLGPGLNVLSGETGAGKSIIVGALSLLLGERASSDVVRAGADRASVEAVFDVEAAPALRERLEEFGLRLEDGLLILRREVAAEGRNRAWVSGSPTTAKIVGELGTALVDLHGQHEHQTLLRPRDQREILDAFGGSEDLAAIVAATYREVADLRRELEEREERRRDVESRADFLRFQLDEIDKAAIAPAEDDALDKEADRLEHGEELALGAQALHELLYAADGAVADRVAEARRRLKRLSEHDAELAPLGERLDDAWHALSDVGRALGAYADSVEHDPGRLNEVRQRLDRLFRLKRKYGPELADVLATAQRVRTELAELDEAEHDLGALRARIAETEARLGEAADRLTSYRREAAARLGGDVAGVLPDLGMPGAAFDVELTEHERVGPAGAESVEFRVAPNPGFDPMPLSRIASGGELSRVMLALKSVLASVDRVPVLVFDEIDAGIGGVVANAVAEKLEEVAVAHQVFVVTHLAQVASRAHAHLVVEKTATGGITTASVRLLEGDERVEEVARMLGGDPESATSREHARELLAGRRR